MQAELIYSQKMESIGIMAGGIAHDFNNILSAILGNVELLRMQESLTESFLQRLNNIEQAARSASQIVSKLLYNLKPPNVKIIVNLYEKPLVLKADPLMLEQCIVNIILNAFDAMPQGGILKVSTTIIENGGDKKAKLSISDTGIGIPPEHLPYIFDPFFTTKKRGKGTGLGLAVVYGIVKEHKGNIEVESYVSQGTTFHIYLPLLQQQEKNITSAPKWAHPILVIDDEESVISFIKEVLEKEGIDVIGTTNPEEGLELFKSLRSNLKIVIVDLVMPNIDGKTLITSLKKLSPTVKIICITGYPNLTENIPFDFLLTKPFDRSKLLETIKIFLNN
jgi:nitrogen-specific signal transduction histidine kinase/CheY-like chemotaxis protein